MNNDELRERAKAWLSKQGKVRILDYTFTSHLMASFAAECVRAEKERADKLKEECDNIYERLSWILAACTIDRDAKNEIEGLLK